MTSRAQSTLVLTKPQADCLVALRNRKSLLSRIAIEAKLDLYATGTALFKLAELGLAEQNASKAWLATARGETCVFEPLPYRPRKTTMPGPTARRLLDLLNRPMHGREIARKLGITSQGVWSLLIRLHAQGRVAFGDPDNPSWLIRRADDQSSILSYDEERVLSVLPPVRATDAGRLRVVLGLPRPEVERILENLIAQGFVDAFEGLRDTQVFRIAAAGLEHHQYVQSERCAPPPRLPVQSDRVRKVLQAISDAGALRIRDVKNLLRIQQSSLNALMQYLKRKQLVAKAGEQYSAPYVLTERGRATLAEMTLRQAA
jgi:DNA-binding IclR family transcriptional regulator